MDPRVQPALSLCLRAIRTPLLLPTWALNGATPTFWAELGRWEETRRLLLERPVAYVLDGRLVLLARGETQVARLACRLDGRLELSGAEACLELRGLPDADARRLFKMNRR